MKSLKKLFLSCAAVAAITALAASSAMAADITATYNDGKVTLTGIEQIEGDRTLLILDENANSAASIPADGAGIKQIDQDKTFAEVPVGELADGTYYVRVGGKDEIEYASFTVGGGGTETKVLIGDSNLSGDINTTDAALILRDFSNISKLEGAAKIAAAQASALNDEEINTTDAAKVLRFFANLPAEPVGTEITITE